VRRSVLAAFGVFCFFGVVFLTGIIDIPIFLNETPFFFAISAITRASL
jgi:hypothetical protein